MEFHRDLVFATDWLVGIGTAAVGIAVDVEILWVVNILESRLVLSQAAERLLRAVEEEPESQKNGRGKTADVDEDGS